MIAVIARQSIGVEDANLVRINFFARLARVCRGEPIDQHE